MRRAKSYGIVDHQLLHGGYLHRMSLEAMGLYLFLSVVSNREGKSYYGEGSIQQILKLSPHQFRSALSDLIALQLVDYRRPFFWLNNLEVFHEQRRSPPKDKVSEGGQRPQLSSNRGGDWHTAKEGLQDLLRSLTHD